MVPVRAFALLAAVPLPAISHSNADWRFDGRLSEVKQVKERAGRCGIMDANLSVMHGPVYFHDPDEPGAELFITAIEMTDDAKACLSRFIIRFQKDRVPRRGVASAGLP